MPGIEDDIGELSEELKSESHGCTCPDHAKSDSYNLQNAGKARACWPAHPFKVVFTSCPDCFQSQNAWGEMEMRPEQRAAQQRACAEGPEMVYCCP